MAMRMRKGRKLKSAVIWLGFCALTGMIAELIFGLMRGRPALPWLGACVAVGTGLIGAAVNHALSVGWIRPWSDLADVR